MTKSLSYKKDYEKHKEGYLRRATERYSRTNQTPEERLIRMLAEAKSRAKKKEIVFDILPEDVKWNSVCPVFGIDLVLVNSVRGGADNSPSLDRIDNTKGYIKGNIRIISNKANKLKNRMTKEECQRIVDTWECI